MTSINTTTVPQPKTTNWGTSLYNSFLQTPRSISAIVSSIRGSSERTFQQRVVGDRTAPTFLAKTVGESLTYTTASSVGCALTGYELGQADAASKFFSNIPQYQPGAHNIVQKANIYTNSHFSLSQHAWSGTSGIHNTGSQLFSHAASQASGHPVLHIADSLNGGYAQNHDFWYLSHYTTHSHGHTVHDVLPVTAQKETILVQGNHAAGVSAHGVTYSKSAAGSSKPAALVAKAATGSHLMHASAMAGMFHGFVFGLEIGLACLAIGLTAKVFVDCLAKKDENPIDNREQAIIKKEAKAAEEACLGISSCLTLCCEN